MTPRGRWSGLLAGLIFLSPAFSAAREPAAAPAASLVWAVMRPMQCLSNAWEKDWLARHKNRADRYPYRQEQRILKEFFKREGIKILEVKTLRGAAGCQSCECERGDTLFLLVGGDDARNLERYGFKKRLPYQPR